MRTTQTCCQFIDLRLLLPLFLLIVLLCAELFSDESHQPLWMEGPTPSVDERRYTELLQFGSDRDGDRDSNTSSREI